MALGHLAANLQPLSRRASWPVPPEARTVWHHAVRATAPSAIDGRIGCFGSSSTADVGPISTISPAYITAIRSHKSRAIVRSWVDKQHGKAEAPLMMPDQIENLALDQIVEIGRRLVGNDQAAA